MMDDLYKNLLDIESFTHMLDDPTECYKFYWMDSILDLLAQGRTHIDFDDIINGMIVAAWYSVGEYHLHLGLKDSNGKILNSLERAVSKLVAVVEIKNDASGDEIINEIKNNEQIIHDEKMQISKMVPYRLLSSFFKDIGGNDRIWDQKKRLISYISMINQVNRLPYIVNEGIGLKKQVVIDEIWKKMLLDNFVQIKGWIKIKKVKYLQDRNPGVPGIIYKLEPENEKQRKLKHVRDLWMLALDIINIEDIYSGKSIKKNDFEVDHFIPWSYIANDEIWNLIPIESSLNSSKSNKLPVWNSHFEIFAKNQYELYKLIYKNIQLMNLFKECQRDNLIALWANEELYVKGHTRQQFVSVLHNYMKPIYDAAKVQGYSVWNKNI